MNYDKVREKIARREQQGEELDSRVTRAIATLPMDELRKLALLYVGETGWLGQHMPSEREGVPRYPCTDENWHACSVGIRHDEHCLAAGGDGNVTVHRCETCPADCDDRGAKDVWCSSSGFDCPTCKMVDQLLALLEEHDA